MATTIPPLALWTTSHFPTLFWLLKIIPWSPFGTIITLAPVIRPITLILVLWPIKILVIRDHLSYYTALSRSSTAEGTVIIQDFNPNKITCGASEYLRQEFRELELMDDITRLRFEDKLPSTVNGHLRNAIIRQYQTLKGESYVPDAVLFRAPPDPIGTARNWLEPLRSAQIHSESARNPLGSAQIHSESAQIHSDPLGICSDLHLICSHMTHSNSPLS